MERTRGDVPQDDLHYSFCQGHEVINAQESFPQEANIYRETVLPTNLRPLGR